jgi:hypothetical protein
MNIENLKLILELIDGVAGDAKEIAIAYMVLDSALPFIGGMVVLAVAYKVATLVVDWLERESKTILPFQRWRDTLHIGSPGTLTPSEIREVTRIIDQLVVQYVREQEHIKEKLNS